MDNQLILVIATRNPGKTKEIRHLLKGFPITIKNLDDFGPIPEVTEDGDTFDDNAYKKSSFTARVLGLPALSDDSGLCVDALDGAPGVYSARYAGENATDEENCAKLLKDLAGQQNRNASFKCVISIAVPSGAALTYEGSCDGVLLESPRGANGFGYDPIFFFPEFNKTFAEIPREEKSHVSHRGKALRELRDEFDKAVKWINQQMPVVEKYPCKE